MGSRSFMIPTTTSSTTTTTSIISPPQACGIAAPDIVAPDKQPESLLPTSKRNFCQSRLRGTKHQGRGSQRVWVTGFGAPSM